MVGGGCKRTCPLVHGADTQSQDTFLVFAGSPRSDLRLFRRLAREPNRTAGQVQVNDKAALGSKQISIIPEPAMKRLTILFGLAAILLSGCIVAPYGQRD